ncbi:MAG: helix-hairpin-helix domain-containing protein [Muribaculaceae bacterium]|nr:helix-hairpin-helix domain-containing protein [Muribaculaceae bacterium]
MRYSYYGRRSKYDLPIALGVFFIVSVLKFWALHPKLFTFIALVGIPLCIFGGNWLIEWDYKRSIKNVRLSFRKSKDTIANAHCTVKFVPDSKLIVMENIARDNRKRMMTLTKKDKFKVNKLWSETCRTFDDFSNFQTLMLLLDAPEDVVVYLESKTKPEPTAQQKKSSAPKQININNSNIGPKLMEMGAIVPDRFGDNSNYKNQTESNFIDIDNINKAQPTIKRQESENELVDMGSALHPNGNKIDVNNVQAAELSLLPGINIVLAKKLIEHRNINGNFKSVEEFLEVANLKPHFISKIKSMIIAGTGQDSNDNNDNYEGRIVDF